MRCTKAFVVQPVIIYSRSDVARFDSGQNMSVILTYVFQFPPKANNFTYDNVSFVLQAIMLLLTS
jgi:hypothetical protein